MKLNSQAVARLAVVDRGMIQVTATVEPGTHGSFAQGAGDSQQRK